MTFEMFLVYIGTLATVIFVLTAFLYMRSEKKASALSEKPDKVLKIDKEEFNLKETKVDIKVVSNNITVTAQDIDAETLERVLESLNAKRISSKRRADEEGRKEGEAKKEDSVKLSPEL